MSTVKISDENKDLIDAIAGQLDTSIKEVVDMIFKWFFSDAGGGGQLVDVDEDEDDEVDEDDEE